jgi:hypothetical protein
MLSDNDVTVSDEQISMVIKRISMFIEDGGGSFRKLLEYLGDADYNMIYNAEGMAISNYIFRDTEE